MTAQRCMLNAWPATLCVHAPVCHERRRRKEGATSLSEPMMDKHRWGARLIAGGHLGIGLLLDGWPLYVYMPASQKHRYGLTSPSHSHSRHIVPHYYLLSRSRRSTLPPVLSLFTSALPLRTPHSCRIVVWSHHRHPSLAQTCCLPIDLDPRSAFRHLLPPPWHRNKNPSSLSWPSAMSLASHLGRHR